jgi:hypothetical protein
MILLLKLLEERIVRTEHFVYVQVLFLFIYYQIKDLPGPFLRKLCECFKIDYAYDLANA